MKGDENKEEGEGLLLPSLFPSLTVVGSLSSEEDRVPYRLCQLVSISEPEMIRDERGHDERCRKRSRGWERGHEGRGNEQRVCQVKGE